MNDNSYIFYVYTETQQHITEYRDSMAYKTRHVLFFFKIERQGLPQRTLAI